MINEESSGRSSMHDRSLLHLDMQAGEIALSFLLRLRKDDGMSLPVSELRQIFVASEVEATIHMYCSDLFLHQAASFYESQLTMS